MLSKQSYFGQRHKRLGRNIWTTATTAIDSSRIAVVEDGSCREKRLLNLAIVEKGKGVSENGSKRSKSGCCIHLCAIAQWCEPLKTRVWRVLWMALCSSSRIHLKFVQRSSLLVQNIIVDRKKPSSKYIFNSQHILGAQHQ